MTNPDIGFIGELEGIVDSRLKNPVAGSYTAALAAAGSKRIAQKVAEEGVELALAAVAGDRDETIAEAADLFYHAIVLLVHHGISLEDVAQQLASRHATARKN